MDAELSHALAGAVGAVPGLLVAVGVHLRSVNRSAPVLARQAQQWAKEALELARTERAARVRSDKRGDDCEKRCNAMHEEIAQLRRDMGTGRGHGR